MDAPNSRVAQLIKTLPAPGQGLREPAASKHHAARMTASIRPNPMSGRAP
jgi:hypothetical protein